MPKPICVKCGLFFKPKRNGVYIEEGMPYGEDDWEPYKIWHADLYRCRGCGTEIVVGFGHKPVAEHFLPNYKEVKQRVQPIVFVKDC